MKQAIMAKLVFLSFLVLLPSCTAWTKEDLELYDLVEETNQNFYDMLGVDQDATSGQIRKAFRAESMKYHPDKNKAADAEVVFRRMVAVGEVLKNSELRTKYDYILKHGLPNWRNPVYYYRAGTKMSLQGVALLIFLLTSFMHYCAMWARYWERMLAFNEAMGRLSKKKAKEQPKDPKMYGIVKPSLWNLLWVRMVLWVYNIPKRHRMRKEFIAALEAEKQRQQEEAKRIEEEEEAKRAKRIAKRMEQKQRERGPVTKALEEHTAYDPKGLSTDNTSQKKEQKNVATKTGPWTEEERSMLAKLIVKFPQGSINRWKRVAEKLGRDDKECMNVAQSIKAGFMSTKKANEEAAETLKAVAEKKKIDNNAESIRFTSSQQQQLEAGLRKYPKDVPERWSKIASMVDGRSEAECIKRVKELVAMVKSKAK
eukprot:m.166608 g.166608  ORF g.166608 m.166608 type:complete len:426 (+) comp15286_c0_seq1:92-1369(+)